MPTDTPKRMASGAAGSKADQRGAPSPFGSAMRARHCSRRLRDEVWVMMSGMGWRAGGGADERLFIGGIILAGQRRDVDIRRRAFMLFLLSVPELKPDQCVTQD